MLSIFSTAFSKLDRLRPDIPMLNGDMVPTTPPEMWGIWQGNVLVMGPPMTPPLPPPMTPPEAFLPGTPPGLPPPGAEPVTPSEHLAGNLKILVSFAFAFPCCLYFLLPSQSLTG